MRTVVLFLCMAAAAAAQQRKQQEPPRTDRSALGKTKTEAVDVQVKSGTELTYDDNFLDLNNKQIEQLEDGSAPQKFKIDDPEDFVYTVWAEIRFKGKLLGDTTQAGLKVQPYFYQSNSIANYEEYELFIRRDIGRHEAGVEYSFDRDCYLRELKHVSTVNNITTTNWESARYDEHEVEAYYSHQVIDMLGVRGSAGWRFKDFESPFEFRDQDGFFIAVGPSVNLGRGFSAFLRYEFSDMTSDASSQDPDTSYRQHEVELGGAVDLLKNALEISLRYRVGFREYTTSNDPTVDPSHADRDDVRQKIAFRVRWKISPSWSVRLEYVYRKDDSHRPFDNNATTSEPGDSTRNTVSIGATLAF